MNSTAVTLPPELVDALLQTIESPEELFGPTGLFHRLKAALMERILEAELTAHLGFERNDPSSKARGNSRNGHSTKTVQTESGPVEIRVPRDRAGSFEPSLVAKHQRRLEGFDEKVLALYARGLSVRDIQRHLEELYGTNVSPDLISRVTDAVMEEVRDWQSRPLDAVYPIVYLDALYVSIRDNGVVAKRAVYIALGTRLDGRREVLGLWIEQSEGAKFWLQTLTELKQRGVSDIFYVCCDGLTGLPKAIEAAFPKTVVQTCIVHMIRASMRYVPSRDRKTVVAALKPIYTADSEALARQALEAFETTWGKLYPTIGKMWRERWTEVVPFLSYPHPIRRILYTTNAIESLNYQLRKVLNAKGHFPSDQAAQKVLFLAIQRAQTRWKPPNQWRQALAHFAIVFGDRFPT